jgi:hypothetical protein
MTHLKIELVCFVTLLPKYALLQELFVYVIMFVYVHVQTCSVFVRSYDLLPWLIVMFSHACEARMPCRSLLVIVLIYLF